MHSLFQGLARQDSFLRYWQAAAGFGDAVTAQVEMATRTVAAGAARVVGNLHGVPEQLRFAAAASWCSAVIRVALRRLLFDRKE